MRKKFRVVVTITLGENPTEDGLQPEEFTAAGGADRADVVEHVQDAVRSWGGQYPPDHPFFPTNMTVSTK